MKRLFIICQRYYDRNLDTISVGGIQTYITNLRKIAKELNYEIIILQYSDEDFEVMIENGRIIGVNVNRYSQLRYKNRKLYRKCMEKFDKSRDILIYATEGMAQKESKNFAIGIQHGVSWDIESQKRVSRVNNICNIIRVALFAILRTQKVYNLNKLVCVDYNYLNWYRTQVKKIESKFEVIPNFTDIPEFNKNRKSEEKIKILFARRFQIYRGTRIFTFVIKEILQKYDNIDITIAGEGPEEKFLHEQLDKYDNVHFIKYKSEDSLLVHSDKHIAVIPTVGSEGTSLSLLEAMASQCAVVCTNVGGMTNVVIDHYNGLMINPQEESLYNALVELIENENLRRKLADNAYVTVKEGFSYELWKSRWINVIKSIGGNKD